MEQIKHDYGRMERVVYYLGIANLVAQRSTCPKLAVGAVLVDPESNKIVAMGYNGSIRKAPHCIEIGCLEVEMGTGHGQKSCIRTIHAELNALLHVDRKYPELHLYSTHQPCFQCFKALVAGNVTRIIYQIPYIDEARDKLWSEVPWIRMERQIIL